MRRTRVRERLLAAADELFYREGVQTVGIERITKRAGASKKSLYTVFGSKEALVVAYLEARRTAIEESITRGLRVSSPRERVLGVFDLQGDFFAAPDHNGCPFLAASAEAASGSLVERAHADYRAWVRALLTELAAKADVPDHEAVGRELHLLYDAASVAASADRDPRRRLWPVTQPPPFWTAGTADRHQGARNADKSGQRRCP